MLQAPMPAQDPALAVHQVPWFPQAPTQLPEKLLIAAAGDEAELLALPVACGLGQAQVLGPAAHLFLGHFPQGKEQMGQKLPGQALEKVGLVLGAVPGPAQLRKSVPAPLQPGVMAGGQIRDACLLEQLPETAELDGPVTPDARVGGAAF